MIAHHKYLGHQAVPIMLHGMAQRFELARQVFAGGRYITKSGQPGDLARGIGKRGGRGFRRTEQGLFAGGKNDISRQIIDA
jgi:hypothetical protein